MKKINEIIRFNLGNKEIVINIKLLNKKIYSKPINILNHYGIVLKRYFNYVILENDSNFIEFLKFNEKNNEYVNDFLTECSFFKDTTNFVNFETKHGKDKALCYGLFTINNRYYCYAIGGSILVKDINTNKVYFYYCDW